jgi:hypothetical protein
VRRLTSALKRVVKQCGYLPAPQVGGRLQRGSASHRLRGLKDKLYLHSLIRKLNSFRRPLEHTSI